MRSLRAFDPSRSQRASAHAVARARRAAAALTACALAGSASALDGEVLHESKVYVASDGIDPSGTNSFGIAIAVEGDRAWIGAEVADHPDGTPTTGAVYVFDLATDAELFKFGAVDRAAFDDFGRAVAVDGGVALVGAPQREPDGSTSNDDFGAAYLFDAATGQQLHLLEAPVPFAGQELGRSVAIDGDRAVVGSSLGAFLVDVSSGVVTALAPTTDPVAGHFGQAVAISEGVIAVSNRSFVHPTGTGSVYLFHADTGQQFARIDHASAFTSSFGWSMAAEGSMLLVGAPLATSGPQPSDRGGAAFLFDIHTGTLLGSFLNSGGTFGDRFGESVALGPDRVLVRQERDDDLDPQGPSRVCVFDPATGEPLHELVSTEVTDVDERFGHSMAVWGDAFLAGAHFLHPPGGWPYGRVYVFEPGADGIGTPLCFGDGSGAACPCGNAGGAGEDCANSTGSGAGLSAAGSLGVGADDLVVTCAGMLPGQPALLFAGEAAVAGGDGVAFGDGLRCAGSGVRRLGVRVPDGSGAASWGPALGALGGWSGGDTRFLQVWYRDPSGGPCSSGFNLSHALELAFTN